MHPDEEIRSPPAKDRTTVTSAPPPAPAAAPQSTRSYLASFIPGQGGYSTPPSPRSSVDSQRASQPGSPGHDPSLARAGTSDSFTPAGQSASPLAREKNRLTVRSWLRSLLISPALINSPVLRSFLLSGPAQLTSAEEADARKREDADKVRDEGRLRFKDEAEKRVEDVREAVKAFRGDLVAKGGLTHMFEVVRMTPRVEDLPQAYRKVLEYGTVSYVAKVDSSVK